MESMDQVPYPGQFPTPDGQPTAGAQFSTPGGFAQYLTREQHNSALKLMEVFMLYREKNDFHVGDFVQWKEGLSCRSVPSTDGVAIVTGVMDEPFFDPLRKSAGNPSFREPLTIRIGVMVSNDIFAEFYMDGGRMKVVPYENLSEDQQSEADKLKDLFEKLSEPRVEFQPGDIVRWKAGMKCTKRPEYRQNCVVMETFPVFSTDKRGACSTGFREPCDVRIGILDEDNDLMIYLFDSRRFEKVPEDELD